MAATATPTRAILLHIWRPTSKIFGLRRHLVTTLSPTLGHGRHSHFLHYKSPAERNGLDKCSSWLLTIRRNFAENVGSSSSAAAKEGEAKIKSVLLKSFPSATNVLVEDISGGCGSMYQVLVETKEFEGLSIVKQHQMVNKALKEEIKDMHGIRIQTQAPKR